MSLIAAFDLSLNSSGVCIMSLDKGSPLHYECISSDLNGIERLHYNYTRYLNILSTYKDISYIAYEGQNNQMRFSYSAGNIIQLAENVGVFKLAVYDSLPQLSTRPQIIEVPAQDIKKFATDNGKATKEDMIAAVHGSHIKTIRRVIPEQSVNDVCDAYHLAKMIKELVSKEQDYSAYLIKDYSSLVY